VIFRVIPGKTSSTAGSLESETFEAGKFSGSSSVEIRLRFTMISQESNQGSQRQEGVGEYPEFMNGGGGGDL
jgi:hypothetical protein